MKYFISLCIGLLALSQIGFPQNSVTHGTGSPILRTAQDISLHYNMPVYMIEGLLKVYERNDLPAQKRYEEVNKLLQQYDQMRKSGNLSYQFSPEQKAKLGISQYKPIENFLEWNTFLTSYGDYSPILIARGDIEVMYGMSQAVFERIWDNLEKKELELYKQKTKNWDLEKIRINLEEELKREAETYRKLDELYAAELKEMDGSYQAKLLIDEGDFEAGQTILVEKYRELDLIGSTQAAAVVAYAVGLVKNLQLDYQGSIHWFAEAVSKNSDDTDFVLQYANQLHLLASHDSAIVYLEKVLVADSMEWGRDSLGIYYNNLGLAYKSLGEYAHAIELYEQALAIDKSAYGLHHPSVAMRYNNLGEVYRQLGEYARAIKLYEQALAIDTSIYGLHHPSVATSYNNLGSAYKLLGKYDRAIELFERANDINIAVYGKSHPRVASTYNNLGFAFETKGEYDYAITLYEQALAIDKIVYGMNHPSVSIRYNNLGSTYESKGEYARAIKLYEQALAIDTSVYGLLHPSVARSYNNLGSAYESKGEYNRAIELFQRANEIIIAVFGENNPNVADTYNNLGAAYRQLGEYALAIELHKKALVIDTVVYGLNHPNVAIDYNNLGGAYESKGEYACAIELYQQTLEILVQFLPPTHPHLKTSRQNLSRSANAYGMEFYQDGQWAKAKQQFHLGLSATLVAGDSSLSVTCLNNLGSSHKNMGQYDSALIHLDWGIGLAEQLDERAMVEVRQLPDSILNHPNFPVYLHRNLLHTLVLRRMYFHKASTLWRMGFIKEATPIFKELWQGAKKREDEQLMEEIKAEGYKYKKK